MRLNGKSSSAVTFLTPTVFRAALPLPSNMPTGNFGIDVKLFSDGVMACSTGWQRRCWRCSPAGSPTCCFGATEF
jgi:Putative transmembrane protein (Alph_Pro_TM)